MLRAWDIHWNIFFLAQTSDSGKGKRWHECWEESKADSHRRVHLGFRRGGRALRQEC